MDVKILKSDLFNNIRDNDYDILVSNPPYVMLNENLPKEVTYEPKIALYSGETGTNHIKKIIKESSKYLKEIAVVSPRIIRFKFREVIFIF